MNEPIQKLKSTWTRFNGLMIHARTSTIRPPAGCLPVVLVHGLGVSSRYMAPPAERLAPFCHVYAPDLPGFGKSAKPDHVLDVPELAEALTSWTKTVGLERVALVGDSFGCEIIAELTVRHPELVDRVVLSGPTTDPRARSAFQQIWRWMRDSTKERPSLFPKTIRDYIDCGIPRAIRTFQYALEDRIEDKLPHMRVPALVIRGERDGITPQRWAEEVARLLPMGRLVVIEKGAHTVHYSTPDEFIRIVQPFLFEKQEIEKRELA